MATVSANQAKDESLANADNSRADMSAEIQEKDQILQMVDSGFDEERVYESKKYQFAMEMIEDPKLKDNPMYEKLKQRLHNFYLATEKIRINKGPTEEQLIVAKKQGYSYDYRLRLYRCLRELIIHIVNEKSVDVKLRQLRKTYQWFINKLIAMGALSEQEVAAEENFLNPLSNQLANSMKAIIKQKVHSALCNPDQVDEYNKAMYVGKVVEFDKTLDELVTIDDPKLAQRTNHADIPPPSEMIKQYKHKTFGKKLVDAERAVRQKDNQLSILKKQKQQEHGLMTAQLGSVYDVPLSQSYDVSQSTVGSTNAGSSSVRFSDMTGAFSQTEGATFRPPFKTFYTNGETEVKYTTTNKFEGKSSYFSYFPTTDPKEQKLEELWFNHKNQQLADKRRDEETAAYLREWSQARGRMESEIQRRKEHLNDATNFEQARGFVRTNFKTKNWNPNMDPTVFDSSVDSEDEELMNRDELQDQVRDIGSTSSRSRGMGSQERDNVDMSQSDDKTHSLNMTRQISETKARKRMFQQKPMVIDVNDSQTEQSTLPSVREQVDTLNAIAAYNKALKPARRKKDKLPELVSTTNIAVRGRFVKDYKKGKIDEVRAYHQVGILDGGQPTDQNSDQYSLAAKQRAIQRASSMQRIDTIRTSYAGLLGFTPKKPPTDPSLLPPATQPIPTFVDGFTRLREPEHLDNPFTPEKAPSQISLSVYNRPASMVARRPHTAYTADSLVRKLPGWKPAPVPAAADGEVAEAPLGETQREPKIPEFKISKQFDFITKDATDTARLAQLEEIQSIRDYLARPHIKREEKDKTYVNIPVMKTFERAILMPAEAQSNLETKKYPQYGEFLMQNPFPKKKKKKGKKGKKKK